MLSPSHKLLIPPGIRFQCTGCGHCCHEYPVPLTDADVMKLKDVDPVKADLSITHLSAAERGQSGLSAFSHSLGKNQSADGYCSFLTVDKRCSVHDLAKPSMCKLFPYTFLICPDGPRVGLSFASTGVLFNSGALLNEQEDLLGETYTLFQDLYPQISEESLQKWQVTQYVAGATLVYDDFLRFEAHYITRLESSIQSPAGDNALCILADMFGSLTASLPKEMKTPLATRFAHLAVDKLDQYLLMPLFVAYIAASDEPVREQFITLGVMTNLQNEIRDLYFVVGEKKISLLKLSQEKIPSYDVAEDDLINRFVFVKLYARLYFGPGFSMLSLLTGIFHLSALLVLVRLALKLDHHAGVKFEQTARLDRIAGLIREIDRRLTAVDYSHNTTAMLELFALDPDALNRFIVLAD